jgi:hypothetical protein
MHTNLLQDWLDVQRIHLPVDFQGLKKKIFWKIILVIHLPQYAYFIQMAMILTELKFAHYLGLEELTHNFAALNIRKVKFC